MHSRAGLMHVVVFRWRNRPVIDGQEDAASKQADPPRRRLPTSHPLAARQSSQHRRHVAARQMSKSEMTKITFVSSLHFGKPTFCFQSFAIGEF